MQDTGTLQNESRDLDRRIQQVLVLTYADVC
jgi:hypothetical protein